LDGATCVPAQEAGTIALCGGSNPTSTGFCIPRCSDEDCPEGSSCLAGICGPLKEPTARITVDTSTKHQTLVGFGASISYVNDELVQHPSKQAVYEAVFGGLGLDVLRLRNRYGYAGDDNLASASEVVAAATASLGHAPKLMLTSWSPPAALKANGAPKCEGSPDTCTLVKLPDGTFDYAGYGEYWRASLDAYAAIGLRPDYIGLQNHPNWTSPASDPMEGCLFLPREGTSTVSIDGTVVSVKYPGFAEALGAVVAQLSSLGSPPMIVAPEVSGAKVLADYAPILDFSKVSALGHHMYDIDPAAVDPATFVTLGDLGRQYQRPLFQTEGQAEGLGTAVQMHYALAVEGAAVYLQNDLVGSALSLANNTTALTSLTADSFTIQAPYHAMRHYAFFTDPGWVRVATTVAAGGLLASAWLSPDEDALSVVIVNGGVTEEAAQLALDPLKWVSSQVVRTVFDGVERSAELGSLTADRVVRLPSHSITTVALRLR
jgi:glucuronoarabinoxylan endo-1,4-beta-xylanase